MLDAASLVLLTIGIGKATLLGDTSALYRFYHSKIENMIVPSIPRLILSRR